MEKIGFLAGMGAGLVVGAAVGALSAPERRKMKTCVGRAVQSAGCAMDSALDCILHSSK